MKITDPKVQDAQLGGTVASSVAGGGRGGKDRAPETAADDRVEVSAVARALARLTATEGLDAVRHERVAALREAIARGEYRIDPETIARGILTEAASDVLA